LPAFGIHAGGFAAHRINERFTTRTTNKAMPSACATGLSLAMLFGSSLLHASSFFDRFKDPVDGYPDASEFLLDYNGILPVPIVITEPAVGNGLGLAGVYFHDPDPAWGEDTRDKRGRQRPSSISAGAVAATSNDSKILGGAHFGYYKKDTIRYQGVVGGADINIDFYGTGDDTSNDNDFEFNAQALFVSQRIAFRLGQSDWFAGGEFNYTDMTTKFDDRNSSPELEELSFDSVNASLGAVLLYDSLNNTFTPSSGIQSETLYSRYDESFGGDFDYDSVVTKNQIHFAPFENWTTGVRLNGSFVSGDIPFYALPYIELRGIPALRYQGENVVTTEVQVNWNFHPRWTVLGFIGAGRTANDRGDLSDANTQSAGGVGFRYLGVRKLGLNMGIDFAKGPEEEVIYISFGTKFQ
jgi:hypothetical protein